MDSAMFWRRSSEKELRFRDRVDAGRRLAKKLANLADSDPLILGLPRGGVVVAAEIARMLGAELDVLVVRKLGAPFQRELGIGAVAPGGIRYVDEPRIAELGVTPQQIDEVAEHELREVDRRITAYRGTRPPPMIEGRTVILVDDGLATGVTAVAASRYVRAHMPAKLILAVPVCAIQAVDLLSREVDEIVYVTKPENLMAVGYWYEDFGQTSDEEVIDILNSFRKSEAA